MACDGPKPTKNHAKRPISMQPRDHQHLVGLHIRLQDPKKPLIASVSSESSSKAARRCATSASGMRKAGGRGQRRSEAHWAAEKGCLSADFHGFSMVFSGFSVRFGEFLMVLSWFCMVLSSWQAPALKPRPAPGATSLDHQHNALQSPVPSPTAPHAPDVGPPASSAML